MNVYGYLTKGWPADRTKDECGAVSLADVIGSGQSTEQESERDKGVRACYLINAIKIYKDCCKESEWQSWYGRRYRQRFESALEEQASESKQSAVFTRSCASSVVTGMGQPSVLETHLTLHPVYGFPYFPGTMIKGAASHYCHTVLGARKEEFRQGGKYYAMLFGSTEEAAAIQYEDAWPEPGSAGGALTLDVLTPHHPGYQLLEPQPFDASGTATSSAANTTASKGAVSTARTTGNVSASSAMSSAISFDGGCDGSPAARYSTGSSGGSAPRDDDTPVPVYFLAAKGRFTFKLLCDPDVPEAAGWLPIAERILMDMLEKEGLGGKASAGYGLFEKVGEKKLGNKSN